MAEPAEAWITEADVAAALRGDQEAQERIYSGVERLVRWRLHRRGSLVQCYGLDDLVQDAAMQCFQSLPLYDPAIARPTTYFARIIRNLLCSRARRLPRLPRMASVESVPSSEWDGQRDLRLAIISRIEPKKNRILSAEESAELRARVTCGETTAQIMSALQIGRWTVSRARAKAKAEAADNTNTNEEE